jgi:hypothetical protein
MFFRLLALFFLSLCILIQPAFAAFYDVSSEDPAYSAVHYLSQQGIINGYPDGSFRTQRQINRAEFTHIMAESFLEEETANTQSCFPDVEESVWFAESVCKMKQNNIIQGYSDGYFQGEQLINFAEASHILYKLLSDENVVSDNQTWFRPSVSYLSEKRAIPFTISEFSKNLTRGEAAQMIRQLVSPDEYALSLKYIDGKLQLEPNDYSLSKLRSDLTTSLKDSYTTSLEVKAENAPELVDTSYRRRRGGEAPDSTENTNKQESPSLDMRRATWIWNHSSASPQEYVDMTLAENITDVFLSSYEPYWAGEYIYLLHQANASISVQLIAEGDCVLDIDPSCGVQHLTLYSDPQQVKAYVKLDEVNAWLSQNQTGLKVAGIHYDVEAYHGNGSYWQCENGLIYGKCSIDNYLEMVHDVLIPLHNEGFTQSVVWGSSRNTTPDKGKSYEEDFKRLFSHSEYQKAVDDVVILAYHDEKTVDDMAAAFSVVNALCTQNQCPGLFPALETEAVENQDVVSFAEEGRAAVDAAIQAHYDAYSDSPVFAGVGIHWLLPYSQMQ